MTPEAEARAKYWRNLVKQGDVLEISNPSNSPTGIHYLHVECERPQHERESLRVRVAKETGLALQLIQILDFDMIADDCVNAYRAGGVDAVNKLLKSKHTGQTLVAALQDLEGTGLWRIRLHPQHREPGYRYDFGVVTAYLGEA